MGERVNRLKYECHPLNAGDLAGLGILSVVNYDQSVFVRPVVGICR